MEEKKPDVHRIVLNMLYRKNPLIANKLHYLRRQRNIADYDTGLVMAADDADKAVRSLQKSLVRYQYKYLLNSSARTDTAKHGRRGMRDSVTKSHSSAYIYI